MKKLRIMVGTLVCMSVLGIAGLLPVFAEEEHGNRVTVIGNATVEAPADSAVIRFEIAGYSRTVKHAQAEADETLAHVREALGEYGTLTEEGFYTHEGYSGVRFCVTRCFSLVTDRVSEIEAIVSLLHDAGVSAVGEVSYLCRDTAPYEAEALKAAVADAKMRAAVLGCLGEPCGIRDMGCFCCPYSYPHGKSDTPTVRVECSVEACFLR